MEISWQVTSYVPTRKREINIKMDLREINCENNLDRTRSGFTTVVRYDLVIFEASSSISKETLSLNHVVQLLAWSASLMLMSKQNTHVRYMIRRCVYRYPGKVFVLNLSSLKSSDTSSWF